MSKHRCHRDGGRSFRKRRSVVVVTEITTTILLLLLFQQQETDGCFTATRISCSHRPARRAFSSPSSSPHSSTTTSSSLAKLPEPIIPFYASSSSSTGGINNDKDDSSVVASNEPRRKTSRTSQSKRKKKPSSSLFERFNELGLSLKPSAAELTLRAAATDKRGQKLGYLLRASCYYVLFLLYRAYRGFFVILPAVFREVVRQMKLVVDRDPFENNGNENNAEQQQQVATTTAMATTTTASSRSSWRTRVTVNTLAGLLTVFYVVGGAARVLGRFVRTAWKTKSVTGSLAAAVQEQERNEANMLQKYTAGATRTNATPSSAARVVRMVEDHVNNESNAGNIGVVVPKQMDSTSSSGGKNINATPDDSSTSSFENGPNNDNGKDSSNSESEEELAP